MLEVASLSESHALTARDSTPPLDFEAARHQKEAVSRALRRAARTARAPASVISGGSGFHARRGYRAFRRGLLASFVICVLFPWLGALVYWGLVASDQYLTEIKFAVRSGESSPLDGLGGMFGLGSSQQSQDSQIIAEYIRSRPMIEAIGKTLNVRDIFGRSVIDYFSRLSPADPVEELEKYWRKRVDVRIESLSGIISVNVRAFKPEDALALGERILDLSERFANELSTRSRRDTLTQSEKELARSEQRLQAAVTAMRDARNREGVLDASVAAEGIGKIVTALRMELARSEQDLASQGIASDSPQSRVIRSRVESIKGQIDKYSRQIADAQAGGGSSTMANRLQVLSAKQVEADLARQQYGQSSAAFESARVTLQTQQAYLVTALRPTLAQRSTYPRRWWEWSLIAFPSLLGWGVLVGIAFLVRDNMAK